MSSPVQGGVATKHDEGKIRYDLIPPVCLAELAKVYTKGAQKYGDHNYLKGLGLKRSRVVRAALGHFINYLMGERLDEEGNSNLAAVAWNVFTLMVYDHIGVGEDDTVQSEINRRITCRIGQEIAKSASAALSHPTGLQEFRVGTIISDCAAGAGESKRP